MKKIKLLCSILLIVFCKLSVAQNNTKSLYSSRGVGELETFNHAYSKSLGSAINGIRSSHMISLSNPASSAALKYVYYDFGLRADAGKSYTNDSANTFFNGNFNYLVIGFPVWRKDTTKYTNTKVSNNIQVDKKTIWSAAFGFAPYSSIGSAYFKTIDTSYGKQTIIYSNTGGLSRVFLQNGFNLSNHFSVGLTTSYVFGQQTYNKIIYLSDSGVGRLISDQSLSYLKGFKFDFGFQGHHTLNLKTSKKDSINGKLISTWKKTPLKFVYGATISNSPTLKYSLSRLALGKSNYFLTAPIDTLINDDNVKGKYYMPSSFTAGFSATYNNLWMFTFDYKTDRISSKVNSIFNSDSFNHASQLSFGFAYRPDMEVENMKKKPDNRFKPNIEYRLGLRLYNTGLYLRNNIGEISQLKEYGISFGLGIPKTIPTYYSKTLKSMINFTYEYIHRGTPNNGLVAENIHRLTLGFTLNDIWFIKRKFN